MSSPLSTQRARTKIVATLGPASSGEEMIGELARAGVDVFRLNMAHGKLDGHTAVVERIRRVSRTLGTPLGIHADLAGPKIRLGEIPVDELELAAGQEIRFVRAATPGRSAELTTSYAPLLDELAVGDRVMLADATVALVVEARSKDCLTCRVTNPGPIRSHQGVNLPGAKLSIKTLSEADHQAVRWAIDTGVDFVGLSFVRSVADVLELKQLLCHGGSRARVIAKIEKPEALAQLEEIIAASDGAMVARGDLGAEIDLAEVPLAQKRIIAECNRQQRPVIVATQMLESMQKSRWPTRAEVADVANAVLDGCDACMLSGETAIGQYPREAVAMMHRVALATEAQFRVLPPPPSPAGVAEGVQHITQAVVLGVERIARELNASLIVVVSCSGATALAMSKRRSFTPVIGLSDDEATLRQMCLFWGVTPLAGAPTNNLVEAKTFVDKWATSHGYAAAGDCVVLVAGTGVAAAAHNLVEVHRV
jgi:pyruvate kinase